MRHQLEALELKDCKAAAWRIPGLLGQDVNGNKAPAGSLRIQGLQNCSLEDSWLAGPGSAWRIPGLLGQNVNGDKAPAGSLRIQGLQSCSLEVSWAAGPEW